MPEPHKNDMQNAAIYDNLNIFSMIFSKQETPTHVSKLVKDLGVQTDNLFSPSAQGIQTANKQDE